MDNFKPAFPLEILSKFRENNISDLSRYSFDWIVAHIENSLVEPSCVVELGAGLGRGSVLLNRLYGWKRAKFYVCDGDTPGPVVGSVNYKGKNSFYNELKDTQAYCELNFDPVENFEVVNLQRVDRLAGIEEVGLCFSLASIGFHWPIKWYLSVMLDHMRKGGILVFQLRALEDKKVRDKYLAWNFYQLDSVIKGYKVLSFDCCKKHACIVLERE